MTDVWQYATFDDWTVVYKNGREIFQHHSPDWHDVFGWLGAELEFLGEFKASDFNNWAFPETIEEFQQTLDAIELREREIEERRAAIRRLEDEIARLENND